MTGRLKIEPSHAAGLTDIYYCLKHGIVPFTPAADPQELSKRKDYPDPLKDYGNNLPQPDLLIPEYRSYTAVETESGVVVFSNGPQGQRQRQIYENYHELNFFNPSKNRTMKFWEVVATPESMQGKADILTRRQDKEEAHGFTHAYVDRTILEQGYCRREFDLTPRTDNYLAFRSRDQRQERGKSLLECSFAELWQTFRKGLDTGHRQENYRALERRETPGQSPEMTFRMKL